MKLIREDYLDIGFSIQYAKHKTHVEFFAYKYDIEIGEYESAYIHESGTIFGECFLRGYIKTTGQSHWSTKELFTFESYEDYEKFAELFKRLYEIHKTHLNED